jgi:hypothetical protein
MTDHIKREVYIGTGELTGFYTLRKVVYSTDPNNGWMFSDNYIKNLSTDPKKADELAAQYAARTGCLLTGYADFDLRAHTNNELLNNRVIAFIKEHQIINFGKYRGRTFSEIIESDPQYMQWLKSEEVNIRIKQPAFKLTTVAIQQLCEEGVLSIPEKVAKPAVEKKTSEFVGTVGEKIEIELKIVFRKYVSSQFGGSTMLIMVDENGNVVKTFTNASWLDEEVKDDTGSYFRQNVIKGDKIKLVGTVSKHDDSYNNEKSTILKRPKLIEVMKEAA